MSIINDFIESNKAKYSNLDSLYLNSDHITKEEKRKKELNNLYKELELLKNQIEDDFSNHYDENNKRVFLNKFRRTRTIKTLYGTISINRMIFKYYSNGKWICITPFDEYILKIPKYKRYDNRVLEHINTKVESKLYNLRLLCNSFEYIEIPISSMSYLIKNDNRFTELKIVKKQLNPDLPLYINIDDTYKKLRYQKSCKMTKIRFINCHQGNDFTGKKINQQFVVYIPILKNHNDFQIEKLDKYFLNSLLEKYYLGCPKECILLTDGAREFVVKSKEMDLTIGLDKWHYHHSFLAATGFNFKNFCGSSKQERCILRKIVTDYLTVGDKENALKVLDTFIEKYSGEDLANRLIKFKKYIENNIKGIEFWSSKTYYPATSECYIFHKIKHLFGNKNKSISLKIFVKFIKKECYLLNDLGKEYS